MINLMVVMGGGAVGAGLRYLVTEWIRSGASGFPYGTLSVNVLGCLLIGLLSASFGTYWDASETTRIALIVGVLGGFTTFSSFGNDTLNLLNSGRYLEAFLYVAVSNLAGLGAVWAGVRLVSGGGGA